MIISSLIPVPFHKYNLFIIDRDGEPYVPMRPIVEAMGLDWKAQYRRIDEHRQRLTVVIMTTVAADGKQREMICIPHRKLFGWLATIQASRTKPEIRDQIILFQNECDDALWKYWTEGVVRNPRFNTLPNGTVTTPKGMPDLEVINGKPFIHSTVLAYNVNRHHYSLMRRIDRMELQGAFREKHIHYAPYRSAHNRLCNAYNLTREGMLLVLDSRFCSGMLGFHLDDFDQAFDWLESRLKNPLETATLTLQPYQASIR
ncbi:MAG: hypothetical protein HQL72_09175 [Magnetococcales bacterium]|nr:hypothetical protein [Magnetococcales bacterium]